MQVLYTSGAIIYITQRIQYNIIEYFCLHTGKHLQKFSYVFPNYLRFDGL